MVSLIAGIEIQNMQKTFLCFMLLFVVSLKCFVQINNGANIGYSSGFQPFLYRDHLLHTCQTGVPRAKRGPRSFVLSLRVLF